MPHVSLDLLEADPASLERLREILHGRDRGPGMGRPPARTPKLAERFGVPTPRPADAAFPVEASVGGV